MNPWEGFLSLLGLGPIRCRDCEGRFSEALLWLPGIHYARCPKCFREDLSDWAEKYFYPPWYKRIFLYFGARRHRCSTCRVNFVSFFPRKRDFSPSWKAKKDAAVKSSDDLSHTVQSEP